MKRTWSDNAREFGALSKQGKDLRLALLAACSVAKGAGGPRTVANATVTTATNDAVRKVSAREFADEAGTTADRVLRHFEAWHRLAKRGLATASADLTPDDVDTYEVSEEARVAFEAELLRSKTDSTEPGAQKVKDIQNNVRATALALEDEGFREQVVRQVIRSGSDAAKDGLYDDTVRETLATHGVPVGKDRPKFLDGADMHLQWLRCHGRIGMNLREMQRLWSNPDVRRQIQSGAQHRYVEEYRMLLAEIDEIDVPDDLSALDTSGGASS